MYDPVSIHDIDKYLGTEVDISLGDIIFDAISLQCGLSSLFDNGSLGIWERVDDPQKE